MVKIIILSILTTLLACDGGSGSSSKGAGSSGGGGGSGGNGGGSRQVTPLVGKILPKLALGERHSCAVTDDGQALCWGKGVYGQLGNSGQLSQDTPVYVVDGDSSTTPVEGIIQITGGKSHTCALNSSGNVFCWGIRHEGQLGNGETHPGGGLDYPVAVKTDITSDPSVDLSNIVQIASTSDHTCALSGDGEVFCWGKGNKGQLGNNANSGKNLPVKVVARSGTTDPLTGIIQIATGSEHTCALKLDGEVYCWGSGQYGQRGDNTTTNVNYPVKVVTDSVGTPLSNIAQVVAGSSHTCALNNSGNVYCWGAGTVGELGNAQGINGTSILPVSVVESDGSGSLISNVTQISAGYRHTCALKTDFTLVCWGYGGNGQLGDNDIFIKDTPVIVVSGDGETSPLSNIVEVAAGGSHTCALNDSWKYLLLGKWIRRGTSR